MAQTKQQIQAFLADAGSSPRHRFGQNFMIDGNLVRLVADAGAIRPGDVVIEVGPGTGTLTEELLTRGADVVAVEIDRDLAAMLRGRYEGTGTFFLIEGDALAGKHEINRDLAERIASARSAARPVKLIANLPYNIASPLVIELLILGVDLLTFTVQKEVAERLRAQAGSDDYGPLTVMAQLLAKVEVLRTLPPQAFWPAPKIDSALVRMTRADQLGAEAPEVGRFVQRLFAARRKTLRKALSQMRIEAGELLASLQIDPQLRPERLTPRQCLELFRLTE
ncbi:MAG TPA: 16S rRNA (adenine(1518)-N(6)/adenine(1519)-N(6))-dimethyltransferase RsmA [Tepidisphaeraceae bacterium]|nr:16S rRNA (adenine(1518)-N(6)/adenine(1519)-N(6))-dimethyltransferase RsmA [Tepidisphaeraceae bacterium]